MVDLFAAMDDLGEAVFRQSNTSHIISSNNIGKNMIVGFLHFFRGPSGKKN